MGTTAKGYPYPEDTDVVAQGAQAIKALAQKIDTQVPKMCAGSGNLAYTTASTWQSVYITFPVGMFPNANVAVACSPGDYSATGATTAFTSQAYTITATGVRIGMRLSTVPTTNASVPISWIAMGY